MGSSPAHFFTLMWYQVHTRQCGGQWGVSLIKRSGCKRQPTNLEHSPYTLPVCLAWFFFLCLSVCMCCGETERGTSSLRRHFSATQLRGNETQTGVKAGRWESRAECPFDLLWMRCEFALPPPKKNPIFFHWAYVKHSLSPLFQTSLCQRKWGYIF